MRPYIAAPAEIEARQQAAVFQLNQAAKTLTETEGFSSARATQALGDLRRAVVETRLNKGLDTLNTLQASDNTANAVAMENQIAAEEALLQATRKIGGTSNPTGGLLRQEAMINKIKGIVLNIASRMEKK